MNVIKTEIPDVLIFEPKVFGDDRGFFFESFNQKIFEEAVGRRVDFVQDNHSKSSKGVIRGLHYQLAPYTQGKLVRCISGEIFDVAVDIRKNSPTLGKWVGVFLSEKNKCQIWIPKGFAHGFIALKDNSEILYKTDNYYNQLSERSIIWSDEDLHINWPINVEAISQKDLTALNFKNAELLEVVNEY